MDRDDEGWRFGNAEALEQWSRKKGKSLRFATNAGIFSWTYNPLGLFIKDGREIVALNSQEGSGNFYMKPNGVFYVEAQVAHIVETSQYHPSGKVSLASQSGPLLLINGQLNPAFKKESGNRTIRNGVGVKDGREAFFAISNGGINFWDFSELFRDKLGCDNALYLDGLISKMYVPELRREQKGGNFAALFAIFEEQHNNNVDATAESGASR
jgi:uncharacterized protein YigE (DUF2233 family)